MTGPTRADTARPSIMVATPCYGGQVTHVFTTSLLNLYKYAIRKGYGLEAHFVGGDALITRARSQLVGDFLATDASHLLFIDADITFEPEQVARLLALDEDVVGALYPLKNIDWRNLNARAGQGEPIQQAGLVYVAQHCTGDQLKTRGDFVTAEYAGTGFLLIKRHVFDKMIAAYPETKFSATHSFAEIDRQQTDKQLYALFDCMIDPLSGHYLSEDYAFCRRWREIGGEIWIDLKSRLAHTGPYTFAGDAARRYAPLLAAKPA